HGGAGRRLPRHQELRVLAQVPRASRPRHALRLGRPGEGHGRGVLLALLRAHRAARPTHGDRARHHHVAALDGAHPARRSRLSPAGGVLGPLLALRRHRMDLPLPAALPERTALSAAMLMEHVVPIRIFLVIFAALILGTAIPTAVAYVDLGPLNVVVMILIAFAKATLVVLFFMHVRFTSRLTQLAAASGFAWLVILIGLTLSDVLTRGRTP